MNAALQRRLDTLNKAVASGHPWLAPYALNALRRLADEPAPRENPRWTASPEEIAEVKGGHVISEDALSALVRLVDP